MPKRVLTEDERSTLTNGLRVAAARFEQDVKEIPEFDLSLHAKTRLIEQFKKQQQESRELADLIDACEEIIVMETAPMVELPEITVVTPPSERSGGTGRVGDGPIEKLCYACGRLEGEHELLNIHGHRTTCPPFGFCSRKVLREQEAPRGRRDRAPRRSHVLWLDEKPGFRVGLNRPNFGPTEGSTAMPLEWTHESSTCPVNLASPEKCCGTTECEGFPSIDDRMDMAAAAYAEYAEADGTAFSDFLRDVLLLAIKRGGDLPGPQFDFSLGKLHEEVAIAYMLAHNIEVPAELPL